MAIMDPSESPSGLMWPEISMREDAAIAFATAAYSGCLTDAAGIYHIPPRPLSEP
jgi:hypothetical protein